VTITGCTFINFKRGIFISGAEGNQIVTNVLQENEYGITLTSSSGTGIVDNELQGNRMAGIYIEDASDNDITGNWLDDANNAGIFLHTTHDNRLYDNTVCGSVNADIYVYESNNDGGNNTCETIIGWSDPTICPLGCPSAPANTEGGLQPRSDIE
jgi:parallel beta-helix repeat protein